MSQISCNYNIGSHNCNEGNQVQVGGRKAGGESQKSSSPLHYVSTNVPAKNTHFSFVSGCSLGSKSMGAATAVLIRASVIQRGEPRLENQSEHLGEERLIGQDANINKETFSEFYFTVVIFCVFLFR